MRVFTISTGRAGGGFRAALLLALGAAGAGSGDGLDALAAKLRSSDKWVRAEAVEELARVGTEGAWELVIGALADPKGEVADTAQVVLAAVGEAEVPEVIERLGKEEGLRSKEPLVRARVAELLGRLAQAQPKLLGRALGDDEAEVRRMAAWSVERLMEAGKLDEAARRELGGDLQRRARSDRDPLVRARALAALVRVAPEAALAAVDEARREREPLLRGAAAILAGRTCTPAAALERLAPLAADPAVSVRAAAVEALGELRTREAAALLVERLDEETEDRLLRRDIDILQQLSGLKHKRDLRPWNDWLRTLPPDWNGEPVQRGDSPEVPPAERTAGLAGLPILSKRVAILIDLSGSIWNVRPDGKTRKQIVDGKLREALEALPADTRFNLIPYTAKPIPWKERLASATPARVREAASWFEACKETGSGNFWDAAMLALEDPEVDTLLVLFDGAPTGGTRHRLELLVPLFLERNFARRVAVDLVLVDATKKLVRLWGELVRETGGRLVAVSL